MQDCNSCMQDCNLCVVIPFQILRKLPSPLAFHGVFLHFSTVLGCLLVYIRCQSPGEIFKGDTFMFCFFQKSSDPWCSCHLVAHGCPAYACSLTESREQLAELKEHDDHCWREKLAELKEHDDHCWQEKLDELKEHDICFCYWQAELKMHDHWEQLAEFEEHGLWFCCLAREKRLIARSGSPFLMLVVVYLSVPLYIFCWQREAGWIEGSWWGALCARSFCILCLQRQRPGR